MTIPRMRSINKFHDVRPPVYIAMDDVRRMIAGYFEVDLTGKEKALKERDENGQSLFDLFPMH